MKQDMIERLLSLPSRLDRYPQGLAHLVLTHEFRQMMGTKRWLDSLVLGQGLGGRYLSLGGHRNASAFRMRSDVSCAPSSFNTLRTA